MNRKTIFSIFTLLTILSFLVAPVQASPKLQEELPEPERGQPAGLVVTTGIDPQSGSINSLSGSTVTFTTDGPGDDVWIPSVPGTFYFVAHSLTTDWEYVYNLWLKFPLDWTVTNVEVIGTPTCTGGGTWGAFSWSFETAPNEVNIAHPRYMTTVDDCTATYAVTATPGAPALYADVSWYWDGDGYGGAPHHPCSSDNYTPPSMGANPCDEFVNPVAQVPVASLDPGLYLFPEEQAGGGCNGEPLTYHVSLYNNIGVDWTFDLDYSIVDGLGTLTGPATILVIQGEVEEFEVIFTPDVCAIPDGDVIGEVFAAGNTYNDTAQIIHTVTSGGGWESIPNSAPSWAGTGYVSDGCTAINSAGDFVTYMIGDASGTGPLGFWGFNHDTNTWFQPAAANTPPDRWAPDWAYSELSNQCFLTGGGTAPGAGNLNDAYVYDPVANSFTALPNFTSVRDFHDSWIGIVDGILNLCIGGGNNGAGMTSTQCMDLSTMTWAVENATIGAMPVDTWGAADGVLHDAGGDLFVSIAGAQSGSFISDAAWYWDDADNLWHSAGNTGLGRYRVEGDFWDGAFYQVAGSDGTFTGTTGVRKGTWDGTTWTWTGFQDVANRRMDNVANTVDGELFSIDGYGLNTSSYVEFYQGCPFCDLRGDLQGHVYDQDYNGGTQCSVQPDSLTGSYVAFDPAAGGDTCYNSGLEGTYCFEAYTFTPDYGYAYNAWLKFPTDWTISDVYVQGTPTCVNGSWGSFSWSFETSPYEVNINHPRYMGSGGAECWATYCVVGTPGVGGTDALASWYWAGDDYGAQPYHPCSSDIYTPASQTEACDEWINPQASVPDCGGATVGPTCTPSTVTINPGNIVVPVDPTTGAYGPVNLIQGIYDVAAEAGGYTTNTASVEIIDEQVTTQNLLLGRADIVLSDTSYSVASPYGIPLYETLTITNSGSQVLDWEILDFGGALGVNATPTTFEVVPSLAADKIDDDLALELAGGPTEFFIWLAEKADLSGAASLQTKEEKGQYVFDALTTVAERTQRELRAVLDQSGVEYEAYYIANKILVRNADLALAMEISGRPDIYRLSANHTFQLDVPVMEEASATPNAIEGNISFISAPDVWAMGFTGEGIVLAGNDTGLDETHPTIAPHYRGCLNPPTCTSWDFNYNWWDATGTYANNPTDGHGHGTHTTGTMVGDDFAGNQIGVAPGAKTVHCKNMTDGGSGDDGTFTTCFQWDLAPWDLTGANPLPSMAPDAINNSWGYWGGNSPQFEDEIAALQAAGILVEVSAGNEGPNCTTLRSPGDYAEVLTTGSVDDEGQTFPGIITMGGWSPSRGPSALYPGQYFPDIMAPGQNIRSSLPGNSWGSWGGTSMAGPHATALVALIWDAAPALRGDVPTTIDIIRQTAGPLTGQPGSSCGGDYTTGPNNDWGHGTINALAAVQLAQQSADLPWIVEVPTFGTLPPGDVQDVDLTFLCTQEQAGDHLLGTLRVTSNDPCEETIDIPLDFYCQGVVGEPDIDINMIGGPLDVDQCPDCQATVDIEICNIGTVDLTWDVAEVETWLSEIPTSGTLSMNECVAVGVTFDSTGMLPGDYAGVVNVNSNDPQTPVVALPATMTVWEPLSGVDFDWTPLSPVVDTPVDFTAYATGEDPIDYAWDFGDGGTATGAAATHTFAAPGDYLVTLVVTNYCNEVTVTYTITIIDVPDITVDPVSLASSQGSNQTVVKTLDIGNVGESDLIWDIIEATGPGALGTTPRNVKVGSGSATMLPGAANPTMDPTIVPQPPRISADILVDQAPSQENGLFIDSSCSLCGTGQQSIADNFIIDDAANLEQIVFWSGYFSSDTPIDPDHIRVLIYEDAGGFPGTLIYDESEVSYVRSQTGVILFGVHEWVHTLTLADQVPLAPGTYWLELFNNTGADDDDFFWETGILDPIHGIDDSLWAEETPGSYWMLNGGWDLSMQLISSSGCEPGDFPWLSVAPDSGTTAPGATSTVDVTFDSTGMAPGVYDAFLCVNSNDPDEPQVVVPVAMTVLSGPEIVVSPLAIVEEMFPDDTTTAILTIQNIGSDPLTFNLAEVLPWLSLSQTSGTVPAGGTLDITVTFDSAGLVIGQPYGGTITVTSNDIDDPTITVDVTLNIVDPLPFKLFLPIVMKH